MPDSTVRGFKTKYLAALKITKVRNCHQQKGLHYFIICKSSAQISKQRELHMRDLSKRCLIAHTSTVTAPVLEYELLDFDFQTQILGCIKTMTSVKRLKEGKRCRYAKI